MRIQSLIAIVTVFGVGVAGAVAYSATAQNQDYNLAPGVLTLAGLVCLAIAFVEWITSDD